MESSQPVFYNPVVTQMEAKSTSSTTVVISSTSGAVPATMGLAPQRQPRTEDDFGSRLRATMAARNEALGQSEITAKSEEAMKSYRATRIQDGKPSGATSTPQTSVQPPKAKGSIAPPMSGPGGPIAVAKNVAATAAQVKESAIPQVQKKKKAEPSPPSSDEEPPISSSRPSRAKMVLRQGPIPIKGRHEAELAELLADEERKKDADKVMIWRKLQAEIAKTATFANE
jgi:hypothetical protein